MPKKILVVDNASIVRIVEITLRRAGYEVITAFEGAEALEKVRSKRPDMIILETEMPGGWEVLSRVKGNPETENIPVLILTKPVSELGEMKGWQAGCASYLTKPFDPREVVTFVTRIFESIENDGG